MRSLPTWTVVRAALRSSPAAYLAAIAAVGVAFVVTAAIPLLRDRFTFFVFWPLIFIVSWSAGLGPGIVATLGSAAAVLLLLPPAYSLSLDTVALVSTLVAFTVAGGIGSGLALWRSQSEQALRESLLRFRSLADSAPVLIWESDPDGRRSYFNEPWLRFTGRRLADEVGSGWIESVHPEDLERLVETDRAAMEARRPFEISYRLRRHDGVYRTVLARKVPRVDEVGGFSGYTGICLDVTDERLALDDARSARAEAEAASRAKDAFLATVSHELRSPLSPILNWAHLLRQGGLDAAQHQQAVEAIERNARSQAQLIGDLVDVSRIASGRLRLDVQPVDIADVVEAALETVRPAAHARSIRLQVVLDPSLGPISGDPHRLQQIVWNLLSNAVKFTPKGGRVHVMTERVNSHVEVVVSDTGAGIPADLLPHLFERFWQAEAGSDRAHGGLGLGLAIARHLAELHGGTLVAESEGAGRGSSFTLKVPLAPLARWAGQSPRRHPTFAEGGDPAERLDGLEVLLVEDERDAAEATRALIEGCGGRARWAGSTSEALEILDGWRPDVIVSDIGMPGEDGYALLAMLRARRDAASRIPAIALTAFASVDDRVRSLSAGFQLHVSKPADPSELAAAIAAVARREREKG